MAFDTENDPREMIQSLRLAVRTFGHPLIGLLGTNFSSPEIQFLFIMLGIRVNICTPVHCKSELFCNCFLDSNCLGYQENGAAFWSEKEKGVEQCIFG